jgi:hypothetical protein
VTAGPRKEEKKGEKRWVAPMGQKSRREGKEPKLVFHILGLLFFFLFLRIPCKIPARKAKPMINLKRGCTTIRLIDKATKSHTQLNFSSVIFCLHRK